MNVEGLRSQDGDVHIAVFDDPAAFPKRGKFLKDIQVKVLNGQAFAVFEGLPPGAYALAAYHDENNNNKFDQGLLGIPLEGFGFSNDAIVFLGPPGFDDAAVEMDEDGAEVTIKLAY